MKRILAEPLLHFLLLGTLLFAAHGLLSTPDTHDAAGTIVVTRGQIEHLATGFARSWQRPPTESELEGLIDDWVREEIATREALALGLDQDDTVIRRRLRQKLEFVSEDIAAQTEPTEAELAAYLQAHPEAFRIEPRFTFRQVYFDPGKRGDNLARDIAAVLAQLRQAGGEADSSALGDSLLLEATFEATPASEVAKQFGDVFAAALAGLPPGQWHGPIESGYGVHLVFVSQHAPGRLPELAAVRDIVHREWANAQRLAGNEKFYAELRKRYSVTIEGWNPVRRQKKASEAS